MNKYLYSNTFYKTETVHWTEWIGFSRVKQNISKV